MAKYSVTGQESGASDAPHITLVRGEYLCTFGVTPNDVLKRHRAAQDGIELMVPTRIMEAGNRFEPAARGWYEDDFNVKIDHPDKGFRNEYCNLVASLDGIIDAKNLAVEDYLGVTHILNGLVNWELKIPGRKSPQPDRIDRAIQVQAQMDCIGCDYTIIAELPRSDLNWNIAVVKRHEPTIDAIREGVTIFWDHMLNETNYPPVTSSEASNMIGGNRQKELIDIAEGSQEWGQLNVLLGDYLVAEGHIEKHQKNLETAKLEIQNILGPRERVRVTNNEGQEASISWTTMDRKAKPAMAQVPLTDKLTIKEAAIIRKHSSKITPAKSSSLGRRFSIKGD